MKMAIGLIAVAVFAFLLLPPLAKTNVSIAIQPLGKVDAGVLDAAESQIRQTFGEAAIARLPAVALPETAYYEQRNRHRAEKLLDYLNSMRGRSSKIVGITALDISTAKGNHSDWGVLGLGELDGHACVVSTYRIKNSGTEDLFMRRFRKLVVHELGHTFGLPHCGEKRCVMQDYKGAAGTLDNSNGDYCSKCRRHVF